MIGVILCGGQGVRYTNMYVDMPKALAPIGNMPILWHLMKYLNFYGINKFVLCLGARGDEIRNYVDSLDQQTWDITCVETGINTPTGGRIKMIKPYIKDDIFLTTYVDGLSNININALYDFFKKSGKVAALTAVRPKSQYGIIEFDEGNVISRFDEKPLLSHYINGGFFIFNKLIFDFLSPEDVLEEQSFHKLIAKQELCAYLHEGFWKSMDTFKENMELNDMWMSGEAEWRVW